MPRREQENPLVFSSYRENAEPATGGHLSQSSSKITVLKYLPVSGCLRIFRVIIEERTNDLIFERPFDVE